MSQKFCVCVPARNEANHIGRLIEALAGQTEDRPILVALCVNNSDDGTADSARAAAARTPTRVDLRISERTFASELAHAGSARRAAMELGAGVLDDDGAVLLSTDADCRPPADWIASNLAYASPTAIVGGRIELDEEEAVPPALLRMRQRFDRYWQDVRDLEDLIDPCSWDPAPRHGDHTGASLALTTSLYRKAGGVPLIASGEDRALVAAGIAAGGRLVHPTAVWTRASARTVGRAAGGMSEDMERWSALAAEAASPLVPAFHHWRQRAAWRKEYRAVVGAQGVTLAERLLQPLPCDFSLPQLP